MTDRLTDFGRLRFELQCVSDYGHEIFTIVEEQGEPSEDPLGGLKGWPGDIQLKAALLLSSQMAALRLAKELEADRDRHRAELDAYKRAKTENDDRFMGERDEARAEVKALKAILVHLRELEDCAGTAPRLEAKRLIDEALKTEHNASR